MNLDGMLINGSRWLVAAPKWKLVPSQQLTAQCGQLPISQS